MGRLKKMDKHTKIILIVVSVGFLGIILFVGALGIAFSIFSNDFEANKEAEQATLDELNNHFREFGYFEFYESDKKYVMYITNELLIREVSDLIDYGYGVDDWDYMALGLEETSRTVKRDLGNGYELAVANPFNEDKDLLIISDGETVYDFTYD